MATEQILRDIRAMIVIEGKADMPNFACPSAAITFPLARELSTHAAS
jgi:hypothetical protein